MTIENLKQIAIKYATTKGSRVPLASDELCNAVVQYFNEFLKITADINTIQVAVTEEGGNIVFTITGNTLDGKAFTPIVITVEHNDFVTDQEFEAFKTTTNAAIQKNTESINSLSFRVEDTENDITTIQVQVGQIKTRVGNTETNIAKINSTLNNKLDKNTGVTDYAQIYVKMANGSQSTINTAAVTIPYSIPQRTDSGRLYAEKGLESDPSSVANMRNIADVEAKIPSIMNLADVTKENTFTDVNHFTQYITAFGVEIGELEFNDDEYDVSISNATIEIFHYISGGNANSIRITDEQIWVKRYDASDYNSFNFPNKSGTLALTSDIIKNPIYFISFYANAPSETCHLIGTMMSKNSYGTGQKTNEEFAVMLADNFYTNSNEGLAVYGKLAEKDILCIYSEDGLSIRCLDETNSEVDLPTVMFFITETEL